MHSRHAAASPSCPTNERVSRFRKPSRTVAVGIAAALTLISGSAAVADAAPRTASHHNIASAASIKRPVLTVSGSTLKWAHVTHAKSYVLATMRHSAKTHTSVYRTLTGSHFTPPSVPGATVDYKLRSSHSGAAWAKQVSIHYRARKPATTASPATPASPPASGSGVFRVAVMGTTNHEYIPGLMSKVLGAGVNWDRIDVGNGSDLSEVQNALSQGMKSLVLYNPGLAGMAPATAAAQVKALAQKLLPLGLTEIEFGNEVYYNGSTPQTYAAQYAAAHAALAGMGITLIANAWGDYEQSNGSWSQMAAGNGWIHDFMAASPGPVDAWSVHPYGPMGQITDGNDSGEGMIPAFRAAAIANGSSAPWYVTEVGQNMGGDVYSPAVTQTQQATDLTTYLNDVQTKYPYVKMLTWYEVVDDSSGQWGLVNNDASSRPSFTALAQWMGTHTSTTNG
jgi:hypothetical protein